MIKDIFSKYFSNLLILVTVVGIVLFGYSLWRDSQEKVKYAELIGTKTKYEQLTKYTAKLESDYRTQKDLAIEAKKRFAEVNKEKDEKIKLLSDATYLIGRHVEKQNGPDYYFETKKRTRNYVLNELRLAGPDSPAVGYIMIKNDGRTYKRNYAFEIEVNTLQTVDEKTGHVRVFSKAFLIKKERSPLAKRIDGYSSWQDKKYPLKIIGGTAIIDPTEKIEDKKILWWAPHTNMGINAGLGSGKSFVRPTLNFSTSGYGNSRNDLDYKFLQFGVDANTDFSDVGVNFIPFSYRFYPKLLTNTYIGPGIGWNKDGTNYFINLNLSL